MSKCKITIGNKQKEEVSGVNMLLIKKKQVKGNSSTRQDINYEVRNRVKFKDGRKNV